jgi:hypothetical protein
MIRLGTALKSTEYPYHRCVVLSDPQSNGGQVLLVRITSDDGTWPDRDCLLGREDWQELDRPSTVAYSTCKCGAAVNALETAIRKGLFTEIPTPPTALLRRMIEAARVAAGMPPGARRWLADESKIPSPRKT